MAAVASAARDSATSSPFPKPMMLSVPPSVFVLFALARLAVTATTAIDATSAAKARGLRQPCIYSSLRLEFGTGGATCGNVTTPWRRGQGNFTARAAAPSSRGRAGGAEAPRPPAGDPRRRRGGGGGAGRPTGRARASAGRPP